MDLNSYQLEAVGFAGGFDTKDEGLKLAALGLTGEAGEVADLIKKHFYHPHKNVKTSDVIHEMGDVLWYLALLADQLGISLDMVASRNISKLQKRYPHGFPQE